MTTREIMRDFLNGVAASANFTFLGFPKQCALVEYNVFGADVWEQTHKGLDHIFVITYDKNNITASNDYADKLFFERCIELWDGARDFKNITLTLLHEFGHIATRDLETALDSKTKIDALMLAYKNGEIDAVEGNKAYFELRDETVATKWALEWLKDDSHARMAKEFEMKFFRSL